MRSKTRNACGNREPLRGCSRQSTPAKKVPSPEETQRANALGGDDGSVARTRGNRRWHRNVFPLSRAIDAGCAGKKHRGASFRKLEPRSRQRLLCRRNPRRDSDALIEDRRSEGDLAHLDAALQKRPGKPARDRKATWRRSCSGRERAEER